MGKRKPVVIDSCPNCVFAYGGEEWSAICAVPGRKHRVLPENHEPDGPPPTWCPLPIVVEKKVPA